MQYLILLSVEVDNITEVSSIQLDILQSVLICFKQ